MWTTDAATFLAAALALLLGSVYVAARWVATWR